MNYKLISISADKLVFYLGIPSSIFTFATMNRSSYCLHYHQNMGNYLITPLLIIYYFYFFSPVS